MTEMMNSDWSNLYRDALSEADKVVLKDKVLKAEDAIFFRLQQLSSSSDSQAEKDQIEEALQELRKVKRDRLNYPDWEHPQLQI